MGPVFIVVVHDAGGRRTLVGIVDQGEDIRVLHHELERAQAFAADARNARQAHWAIQRLRAEHDDSFHDIESD